MTPPKIGATVTHALFEALEHGSINVDYIKVDADLGLEVVQKALNYAPVLIHDISYYFWLNYDDPFQPSLMDPARQMLDLSKGPWFSTGIGASAEPQGHTLPYWRGADSSQLQTREHALSNIIRNGRRLQEWVGIPLLLENYNYHPTNAYEYVCEPDTFSTLIEEIGCGVLLDLAHAQISAHNMGWPTPQAYLERLPLHKVREIHVNHPGLDDAGSQMLDRHYPFIAEEVDLLKWVIDHAPVEVVTLESSSPTEAVLIQELELIRGAIAA